MSSFITLKIRLGPLVSIQLTGENCEEIVDALEGFQKLNHLLEDMCGDLAERAYPQADEEEEDKEDGDQEEEA